MKSFFSFLLFFSASSIFAQRQAADLIVHNANVYTVNARFDVAESFAVKDGKIVGIGSTEEVFAKFQSANLLDARGQTVLPGLIDVDKFKK